MVAYYIIWAQLFTSLLADLHQDILVSVNFKDLTLTEDFLQGNIQLGLLLNSRPRDGDLHKNNVNDWALHMYYVG